MTTRSRIEWTEHTWNPVTGCTNVSPGCKHCYARVMAARLQAMRVPGYDDGFAVTLQPNRLSEPLLRRRPTVYSWFMQIACDRCGKDRMLSETYTPQRDMLIRDIIKLMRHAGCGGRASKVELISGIEGAGSQPVRRIVLMS